MHTVLQAVQLFHVVFNNLFADILRIEDFGEHNFWGWHWVVLHIQVYMGRFLWDFPDYYFCLKTGKSIGSGSQKTISLCLSSALPLDICFVLNPPIVCTLTLCPPCFAAYLLCADPSHLSVLRQHPALVSSVVVSRAGSFLYPAQPRTWEKLCSLLSCSSRISQVLSEKNKR